jgi:hypothetical protein
VVVVVDRTRRRRRSPIEGPVYLAYRLFTALDMKVEVKVKRSFAGAARA